MKYYWICFIFLVFACNSHKKNVVVTIQRGDTIIKGNIINDTLFNDTISFYDLKNNLISEKFFKDGKENGMSIDYFLNKIPYRITNYTDGLKNGYNTYYDSLGNCFYKDFYYFNVPVGPIIFYNKDKTPKTFYFANLQNQTLLDIDYKNWRGIKSIATHFTNFIINNSKIDSKQQISLLLYVMTVPKLSLEYSILKKKKTSENDFTEVEKIHTLQPFILRILPSLPVDENYSIGLTVYDSILNKKSVIYEDF